jgi:hypothetical protein
MENNICSITMFNSILKYLLMVTLPLMMLSCAKKKENAQIIIPDKYFTIETEWPKDTDFDIKEIEHDEIVHGVDGLDRLYIYCGPYERNKNVGIIKLQYSQLGVNMTTRKIASYNYMIVMKWYPENQRKSFYIRWDTWNNKLKDSWKDFINAKSITTSLTADMVKELYPEYKGKVITEKTNKIVIKDLDFLNNKYNFNIDYK